MASEASSGLSLNLVFRARGEESARAPVRPPLLHRALQTKATHLSSVPTLMHVLAVACALLGIQDGCAARVPRDTIGFRPSVESATLSYLLS